MWEVCVSPLCLAVIEAEAAESLRLMPADSGSIVLAGVRVQFRGTSVALIMCSCAHLMPPLLPSEGGGLLNIILLIMAW